MAILTTIIENWAKVHGVKSYTLRHETLIKPQLNGRLICSPGCVFFYKFEAEGEINNITDLQKPLLQIKTHDDFLDLGQMVMHRDGGTLQHVESNFVFTSDSEAYLNLVANEEGSTETTSQFANIYNACLHYIKLTPSDENTADDDGNNRRSVHVEI